jgi:hypothetical protein
MRCVLFCLWLAASTTAAAGAPPSPAPAGHPPADEAAVLATMDRYLTAISSNDLATLAAMQTPEGMTYRARAVPGGGMEVVAHPNTYWSDPVRKTAHAFLERYWSPTVMIRGSIAVVWAPYEFQIDGKTSHCGIDVFDFVKLNGEWKVANAMWTVEPDACAELRPADPSAMRP